MKKLELVFTPLPLLSHLVPAIELAKQLIKRQPHLQITIIILSLPFDPKAQSYTKSIPRESMSSSLKFVHLPRQNFSLEINSSRSPARHFFEIVDLQKALVKEAVDEIISGSNSAKLAGFVVDMFCTSMIDVANAFGVPTYVFYILVAGSFATLHYHSILDDQKRISAYENSSNLEISIPCYTNPVPVKLLSSSFFHDEAIHWILHQTRRLRETKGIFLNSFKEFESNAVNFLINDEKLPPIYPIGPAIINFQGIESRVDQENGNHSLLKKWLDDQPDSSVVFLSFGSGESFKAEQVKEIAYALERSGQRFIWSLRLPRGPGNNNNIPIEFELPPDENMSIYLDVLPEGFLKRTQGKGRVMQWVPQIQVLSHPSVSGFVTHCGSSSVMESVYFGVPMGVWPMHSDQQLTAFLLVKELGIGVDIKMDYRLDFRNRGPITFVEASEIETGIRELMDPRNGIRIKVREMKEKARMSVVEGGSSHISMETALKDIFQF